MSENLLDQIKSNPPVATESFILNGETLRHYDVGTVLKPDYLRQVSNPEVVQGFLKNCILKGYEVAAYSNDTLNPQQITTRRELSAVDIDNLNFLNAPTLKIENVGQQLMSLNTPMPNFGRNAEIVKGDFVGEPGTAKQARAGLMSIVNKGSAWLSKVFSSSDNHQNHREQQKLDDQRNASLNEFNR